MLKGVLSAPFSLDFKAFFCAFRRTETLWNDI